MGLTMNVTIHALLRFPVLPSAGLIVTGGGAPQSNPWILAAFFTVFAIPPLGAFWMMYVAIRYEERPLPMILLAVFVPFTFVWYYFARVRPGKVRRSRSFA